MLPHLHCAPGYEWRVDSDWRRGRESRWQRSAQRQSPSARPLHCRTGPRRPPERPRALPTQPGRCRGGSASNYAGSNGGWSTPHVGRTSASGSSNAPTIDVRWPKRLWRSYAPQRPRWQRSRRGRRWHRPNPSQARPSVRRRPPRSRPSPQTLRNRLRRSHGPRDRSRHRDGRRPSRHQPNLQAGHPNRRSRRGRIWSMSRCPTRARVHWPDRARKRRRRPVRRFPERPEW